MAMKSCSIAVKNSCSVFVFYVTRCQRQAYWQNPLVMDE
ncbi:hypothetical protein AD14_0441 [Escherichia coli 3-073-06_S4_C2]|nr:hypothetical protein AD14_0441 [Escherichia coli 3-073-06_S4_C2]